ncbi:MAG TPA: cytochrome c oxidase assembly protein [Ktedonobacteraceae bacterium]|nr:cytochrome c oxidase assembly protein [Ktedonobacteraceae bacterium]
MAANIDLTFWLTAWNLAPSLILGTILVVGLYFYILGPYHKRYYPDIPIRRGQTVAFLCGVLIILLALISPIDELGDDYLFSAHMVQHLCLTTFGPPLLLVGISGWMLERLLNWKLLFRVLKGLTWAPVAFFLYNADFFLWHAPALYDATLRSEAIHIFEHLTFIGFGILSWWPILSPSPRLPRLSLGGQILYIFLNGMPAVLLGAGLTFASPLYAPYLAAPLVWGISHAVDQQLGGLIMWVPVNLFYICIMSGLFIRWMQRQEAQQIAAEQRGEEVENDAGLVNSHAD